jgi:hypothetical protein
MLRAALDELLENDLVQEAIRVALVKGADEALLLRLTKHGLPAD